jgi:hypothetical protein
MKILLVKMSQFPFTLSLSQDQIHLGALSDTLNLCCSFRPMNQVSYSCKIQGNIIVSAKALITHNRITIS